MFSLVSIGSGISCIYYSRVPDVLFRAITFQFVNTKQFYGFMHNWMISRYVAKSLTVAQACPLPSHKKRVELGSTQSQVIIDMVNRKFAGEGYGKCGGVSFT